MKLSLAQMKRRGDGGPQLVYVRISHLGYVRYVSLGFSVEPKLWNARAQEVRAGHDDQENLNRLLKARLAQAKSAAAGVVLTEGKRASVLATKAAVVAALHPESAEPERVPALPWLRSEVERDRQHGRYRTALAYTSVLNRFAETMEQAGLPEHAPFQAMTYDLVARHRDRVQRPADEKVRGVPGAGHAPSYVHKQVTTLRALFARAERDGVPGAADALAAARRVQVKRGRPERARVPLETVEAYAAMELSGRAADVRDWWVFAFFAGGMRLGDVCRLRWDDVVWGADGDASGSDASGGASGENARVPVAYRMEQQKTGRRVKLPLLGHAQAVVERWTARTYGPGSAEPSEYVFGLLAPGDERDPAALRRAIDRRGAVARRYLARVSEAEGWPRLGFHSARHSLADHLRKSGTGLYDISKILGHTRLSTTEQYLSSFDEESAGSALRDAFGR